MQPHKPAVPGLWMLDRSSWIRNSRPCSATGGAHGQPQENLSKNKTKIEQSLKVNGDKVFSKV